MAAPAPGAPAQQQPDEFDLARKRAAQQNNAAVQQQRDAIKRRAAAQGGLNSGAFIKQEQQAMQQGQQQLAQANEGIDTAQRAENRRVAEIKEGRDFQRGEREAGQKFSSEESALQRRFLTGEREAGQQFSASQLTKEIEARYDLQAEQIEAAATEGRLNREQADEQLRQLKEQADREYDEAKKVNYITTALSAKNSGLPEAAINALMESYKNGTPLPPGWPNLQTPSAPATASTPTPATQQRNPDGTRKIIGYQGGRPIYADGGA